MFPFLIGKVLTFYWMSQVAMVKKARFPFLIGKVLTLRLLEVF